MAMAMAGRRATLFIPAGAVVLFVVACGLPALTYREVFGGDGTPGGAAVSGREETFAGWVVLLGGWSAPATLEFGWYATPCLFAAWACLATRRQRLATICAALAVFCAASLLLDRPVHTWSLIAADSWERVRIAPGGWCWVGSIVLTAFVVGVRRKA